ncbi:MAG: response regulator, partial [Desulfobacterales bacterium]|nr:response regulator [Desulfobacterales bacterium]
AMSETGGEFTLSLESCRIEDVRARLLDVSPGAYLKLSIQDNGPGIPADILDKIFDPFFTTKSKDVGTGLGLSVVHGIIKGHKGAIQVSSVPMERTEFRILLPRTGTTTKAHAPGQGPSPGGGERILFVEDNPDQRESIPRTLTGLGYRVTAVGSALDALAEFYKKKQWYDLVITDYDMPGTNGADLARELMDIAPDLSVIMVSGREAAPEIAKITNIKRFILKPYGKQILSTAVRSVMDMERKTP